MTDGPELVVSTDHAYIEVVDRETAELALGVIEPVLSELIGKGVGAYPDRPQVKYIYDAECPECGHEWERHAKNPKRATCPECLCGFSFSDDELAEKDMEVVEL